MNMDGEIIIEGFQFATCGRCRQIVVLGDDGLLAGEHTVPCGAICELSAGGGDTKNTCNGWCERCRTIVTGCDGDPSKPCGQAGCPECGVHISASEVDGSDHFMNDSACGQNRSLSRFAWSWHRVTCRLCLVRMPSHAAQDKPSVKELA